MLGTRRTQRVRASGFTLLEIMVALAAGGIALTSLYAIGAASSRHFREQQRISAAQTSLRAAVDVLKHDFQRAGFLGTPLATAAGEACASTVGLVESPNQLAAVAGYIRNDTKPANVDPKAENDATFFSVDRVWLTGNYATSGEYAEITVDGELVTFPTNWQSFRRDFSRWNDTAASSCDNEAFQAAFAPNRLVRLHSLNGGFFYAAIATASCVDDSRAQVRLKTAVPASCGMTNGWIAPVNTISYAVEAATAAERGNDPHMTILRRTEVRPDARSTALTLPASEVSVDTRAIAENVVRFRLDFLARNTASVVTNFLPISAANVIANPERLRGVIIDIAVRTAQQESNFLSKVLGAAYIVDSEAPGAARVRRAHAELLLPNIASRRL